MLYCQVVFHATINYLLPANTETLGFCQQFFLTPLKKMSEALNFLMRYLLMGVKGLVFSFSQAASFGSRNEDSFLYTRA